MLFYSYVKSKLIKIMKLDGDVFEIHCGGGPYLAKLEEAAQW